MPEFSTPAWLPDWVLGLMLIAAALVAALFAHQLLVRAVGRGLRRRDAFTRSLVVRTRGPSRFALVIAALSWAARAAPVPPQSEDLIQRGLAIAFIVLCGWIVMTAIDIGSALYMRRFRTDAADNLQARKLLTQTRILRRSVNVVVLIVTVACVLMAIPGVKQVGVSLLAAGGAAGIIVGLALQPVLSNMLVGLQLAVTQPIRIDDAVVVQGEFGHVEEIKSTYVVIRLWDLRRMVVPLKYFLDQPFQNWTRESAEVIGTVMLYLDYSVPVAEVRARFEAFVKASPLWDGKTCAVQVTDARERSVEVRGLLSARNAGQLFDLRCEVREKMITWLQAEYPQVLPRERMELLAVAPVEVSAPSDAGPGPGHERVQ
jgi:small-conductance mechanosensitive channel